MRITEETFSLANGIAIPKIGFGTWQIPNGEAAYQAVASALKLGYRHIDTALGYGNEESVGKAIRDSGIARKEIFVTSKLPAEYKSYDSAWKGFEQTMQNLGLDSLDLYLIHAPWPWDQIGADYTTENIEVWKAMEEIYQSGRCRAIGVSNFSISDLEAVMKHGSITPMANQIKYYIGNTEEELTRFCQDNRILVEGYSPLATGGLLNNSHILAIAQKYGATLPQICIRYVLQKGVLPLPKSTHPAYIRTNAEMEFEISREDMEYLDRLTGTTEG